LENVVSQRLPWNGRRVLLTGHTGFKGAWLTLWLRELGAEIHGYSLAPPTEPNLFEIARVGTALTSDTRADIRDLSSLGETLRRVCPEVVLHLAAQPLVRLSYVIPAETFDVNVMGTVNLLQAIQQAPSVRAAIIVTTDKCYENDGGGRPFRETDPVGGHDPYSASKACAEIAVSSFRSSAGAIGVGNSGAAIASVRAGNVVGGGDWAPNRLVPDCIRAFAGGVPVLLRYPRAIRPWLHVLEPLAGYITLAERLLQLDSVRYATAFNFGPGHDNDADVLHVAESVARLWGNEARVEIDDGPHPPEEPILRLDTAKAHTMLSWEARWDIAHTLERTVEWYRAWHSGQDVRPVMARQLAEFMTAAGQ
jgi:CDP-glucose 4,6-dehydratase